MPADGGEIRSTLLEIYFIAVCWTHISSVLFTDGVRYLYVEISYLFAIPILTFIKRVHNPKSVFKA